MIIKELFAKLGLEVDETGFNAADALLGGVKAGLLGLAGLAVGAATGLAAMVVSSAESAHHLDLVSQQAGVSATTLQGLAYAGSFVGLTLDDVGAGMGMLTRHMAKAASGSADTAAAFSKLGVNVKGSDGKLRDTSDVMLDLADKLAAMPDGAEKTAAAFGVLGRGGAQFIPLLNKGKDGIAALIQEANDLKLVAADDSVIEKRAEFAETMNRVSKALTGIKNSVAGGLVEQANELGKAFFEWIKANRELVKSRIDKVVFVLRIVLGAMLFVLRVIFIVIGWVVDNFKLLAFILSAVVLAALVVNAAALWELVAGYAAAGLAGLVSAVKVGAAWLVANAGLILVALALLLILLVFDDINSAMKGGKSLLKEWLGDWKDDSPGDPWWLRDFKSLIYAVMHFDDVMSGLKSLWSDFWKWLEEGWDKTGKSITNALRKVVGLDPLEEEKKLGPGDIDYSRAAQNKIRHDNGLPPLPETYDPGPPPPNLFGAGASPKSSASSFVGAKAVHHEFNVKQDIHGAPGQSPQEIANASVEQLREWQQQELENADAAF